MLMAPLLVQNDVNLVALCDCSRPWSVVEWVNIEEALWITFCPGACYKNREQDSSVEPPCGPTSSRNLRHRSTRRPNVLPDYQRRESLRVVGSGPPRPAGAPGR